MLTEVTQAMDQNGDQAVAKSGYCGPDGQPSVSQASGKIGQDNQAKPDHGQEANQAHFFHELGIFIFRMPEQGRGIDIDSLKHGIHHSMGTQAGTQYRKLAVTVDQVLDNLKSSIITVHLGQGREPVRYRVKACVQKGRKGDQRHDHHDPSQTAESPAARQQNRGQGGGCGHTHHAPSGQGDKHGECPQTHDTHQHPKMPKRRKRHGAGDHGERDGPAHKTLCQPDTEIGQCRPNGQVHKLTIVTVIEKRARIGIATIGYHPKDLAVAEEILHECQKSDTTADEGNRQQQAFDLVGPSEDIEHDHKHTGHGQKHAQVMFRGVGVEADGHGLRGRCIDVRHGDAIKEFALECHSIG